MSHALLSTWTRADRNRLTVDDYVATGGIRGAVQQSAEDVYGSLDAAEQELSRRLFTRLVHVEDAFALTRRRVDLEELTALAAPASVERVLGRYIDSRLVTSDADSVHISHEALLVAWPRLHEWVAEDRAGARVHRQVTDAANLWADSGHDETLLLGGGRLTAALEWRTDPDHEALLNERERDFVDRSDTVDQLRRTAQRRANRRLKSLLAAVVVLLLAATALTVVTSRARNDAEQQRAAAAAARDEALSRVLAADSDNLVDSSPNVAAQLAVQAMRIDPTREARNALLDRTGQIVPTRLAPDDPHPLQAVAASASRGLIAAAGTGGRIDLWRVRTAGVPTALPSVQARDSAGGLLALAFTPGGASLFSAGTPGQVTVWDTHGPTLHQVATLHRFTHAVYALATSPDGTLMAGAGADRAVCVWPLADSVPSTQPRCLQAARSDVAVHSLAFTPDSRRLVVGLANGRVRVVRADDPSSGPAENVRPLTHTVTALAIAPDGRTVAAGGPDRTVSLVPLHEDGTLGEPVDLMRAQTPIDALAFRPAGARLLVGSADQAVREFDLGTPSGGAASSGKLVRAVGTPEPVTAIAVFGSSVATAGTDGYVEVWAPSAAAPARRADAVGTVALASAGSLAVIGDGPQDDTVEIWRTDTPAWTHLASVHSPDRPGPGAALSGSAAISADGTLLASGTLGGRVHLWDLRDPTGPAELPALPVTDDAAGPVEGTAFSPDGRLLAAAGDAGTVRLWDVSDPRAPLQVAVLHDPAGATYSPSFSHDSRFLAVGSTDRHVYVWAGRRCRAACVRRAARRIRRLRLRDRVRGRTRTAGSGRHAGAPVPRERLGGPPRGRADGTATAGPPGRGVRARVQPGRRHRRGDVAGRRGVPVVCSRGRARRHAGRCGQRAARRDLQRRRRVPAGRRVGRAGAPLDRQPDRGSTSGVRADRHPADTRGMGGVPAPGRLRPAVRVNRGLRILSGNRRTMRKVFLLGCGRNAGG